MRFFHVFIYLSLGILFPWTALSAASSEICAAQNHATIEEILKEHRKNEKVIPVCHIITLPSNPIEKLVKFPKSTDSICEVKILETAEKILFISHLAEQDSNGICLIRTDIDLLRDVKGNYVYLVLPSSLDITVKGQNSNEFKIDVIGVDGTTKHLLSISHRAADKLMFDPKEAEVVMPEAGGVIEVLDAHFGSTGISSIWYTTPNVENEIYSGGTISNIKPTLNGISLSLSDVIKDGVLSFRLINRFGETQEVKLNIVLKKRVEIDPDLLKISRELSLAKKLQADETYLRAGTTINACNVAKAPSELSCKIRDMYEGAYKSLPDCSSNNCSSISLAEKQTIELIKADVVYRQGLLDKGISFFGGYRTLKQTTPHQELIKMKALLARVTDTVDRIERWQWRSADMKHRAAEVSAERSYVMGQIKSEEISTTIHRVKATNFDAIIAKNKQRQLLLADHISQLSERAESVASQQDQLNKQASGLIQSGIAAATGIPLEQVQAAAKGDVQALIKSQVKQLIKDQGSAFTQDFIANSEVGQSIGEAYQELRLKEAEIKKTVNDVKRAGDEVKGALKDFQVKVDSARDMSKALSDNMGNALYKKLSKEAKTKLDELVKQTKPIGAAIESQRLELLQNAKEPVKQMQAWVNEINKAAEHLDIDKNKAFVNTLFGEIEENLRSGLNDASSKLVTQQIAYIIRHELIDRWETDSNQIWPRILDVYPQILNNKEIIDALGKVDSNDIAKAQALLINPPILPFNPERDIPVYLDIANKSLVFMRRGNKRATVKIEQLLDSELNNLANLTEQQVLYFLSAYRQKINPRYLVMIESALAGPERFSSTMQLRLTNYANTIGKGSEEFDKFWQKLYTKPSSFQREYLGGQLALTTAFYEEATTTVPAAISPMTLESQSTSDVSPETNAAIAMALNSAFPGAGVAFSLGQTYAAMDANRQLLEQLNREIVAAILDYHHIQDAIEGANIDAAIAKLEQQRADAIRAASLAQLQQYAGIEDMALEEHKLEDIKLRLYRPFLFYNAEMLRERFDAFDRSLALWSAGRQESGFFANRIMQDPRNSRLALDSEIHLFNWLNRDREAAKTDPYHLLNHWKQMIALAEDYCADYGCKPGDGKLGKIGATVPIRLLQDLAGASKLERFHTWRKEQGRSISFDFPLTISPSLRLVPRDFINIRLLDVNIIPVDRNGQPMKGNMVNLKHTGFSTIPLINRERDIVYQHPERLLMSSKLPPSNAIPFDLTTLAERFQSQVSMESLLPLRGFEGYGLFGQYEVSIHDMPGIEGVHDFEVQIAYIYQEPTDSLTEADVFETLMQNKLDDCEKLQRSSQFGNSDSINVCQPKLNLVSKKPILKDNVVTCNASDTAELTLTDTRDISMLLELSLEKNSDAQGGINGISTGFKCLSASMPTVSKLEGVDYQALLKRKPNCSIRELLVARSGIDVTKLTCYGE